MLNNLFSQFWIEYILKTHIQIRLLNLWFPDLQLHNFYVYCMQKSDYTLLTWDYLLLLFILPPTLNVTLHPFKVFPWMIFYPYSSCYLFLFLYFGMFNLMHFLEWVLFNWYFLYSRKYFIKLFIFLFYIHLKNRFKQTYLHV